jgi:hypothetical protein
MILLCVERATMQAGSRRRCAHKNNVECRWNPSSILGYTLAARLSNSDGPSFQRHGRRWARQANRGRWQDNGAMQTQGAEIFIAGARVSSCPHALDQPDAADAAPCGVSSANVIMIGRGTGFGVALLIMGVEWPAANDGRRPGLHVSARPACPRNPASPAFDRDGCSHHRSGTL